MKMDMKMKALDMLRDRYSAEGAKSRAGKKIEQDQKAEVELVGADGFNPPTDAGLSEKASKKLLEEPEIRDAQARPEEDEAEHSEGEKLREMARKRLSRKTGGNKVINMGSPY